MGLRITEDGVRKVCAVILVGTIAGAVSYGQVAVSEDHNINTSYYNELLRGHYFDEDVKKNREDLLASIENGGSSKAKIYGKKKELVPKTIKK